MKTIYIAPYEMINDEVLSLLEVALWQIFGFTVKRLAPLAVPSNVKDERTGQWNSTVLLKDLLQKIPGDAVRVLGVTTHDLFIPMLSFVFGHAQVNGPAAVISLARLRQEFYQLPGNNPLFHHRITKEAVHELGHTFGLLHCSDQSCAMSLSNSITQVDKKTEELCKNCSILFEENTQYIRRSDGMEIQQ